MRRQQGFTLIELMIVVAIIAILSAIAIPAYSEYVMRSRITAAISMLSAQRLRMEQFYQDHRTYDGSNGLNSVAPCPAAKDNFSYTCTPSNQTYALQASGTGPMAGFTYNVDQANIKSSSGPTGWASPNPNNCWLVKKDGSC